MTRKNRKKINKFKSDMKQSIKEIQSTRKGMGPLSTLTMIFVVLKMTNNIDWSWVYVLSPIWFPFGLILMIAFLVLPIVFAYKFIEYIFKMLKGLF